MNNMRSSSSWSAPIGIVLSGNIGERYGKPLLACATDYWVTATIRKARVQKAKNPRLLHIEKGVKDYLRRKSISFQVPPYTLNITRDLSGNFDYKAAETVVITACLLDFFSEKNFSTEEINTLSFYIEKKLNRTELGYRTSVSCFGGLIYARREFEFLKVMSSLPLKIPQRWLNSLSILPNKNSVNVDKFFGRLYNKNPGKMEECLNLLEKNTRRMTAAIASENLILFKQALLDSQNIYNELNIKLSNMIFFSVDKKKNPLKVSYLGLRKVIDQKSGKQRSSYL